MMGGEIITRPKPAEASRRNDGNWIRGRIAMALFQVSKLL